MTLINIISLQEVNTFLILRETVITESCIITKDSQNSRRKTFEYIWWELHLSIITKIMCVVLPKHDICIKHRRMFDLNESGGKTCIGKHVTELVVFGCLALLDASLIFHWGNDTLYNINKYMCSMCTWGWNA